MQFSQKSGESKDSRVGNDNDRAEEMAEKQATLARMRDFHASGAFGKRSASKHSVGAVHRSLASCSSARALKSTFDGIDDCCELTTASFCERLDCRLGLEHK